MEVTGSAGNGDMVYIQIFNEISKRTFPSKKILSNLSSEMLTNGKILLDFFYSEESNIEIKFTLFYYENIKYIKQ
jgi:broad-specificity NMP kinase